MSRFASMAGEAVAELAERVAEAGRSSRGRALFRKGSVSDLTVGEGSVFASVRGSEGDLYETTVATDLAPPGVLRQMLDAYDPANPMSIDDMIAEGVHVAPRDVDLAFSCDCGDWEEPCKHAVAVLLALADRVDLDEAELLHWRGIDLSTSMKPTAEDSAPPAPAPSSAPSPSRRPPWSRSPEPADESEREDASETEPGDRTARLSELEALLGDTVVRVPPKDDTNPKRATAPLDPVLADFLGVGTTLEPIDVGGISAPAPLFADVQLGPLADLGPALADAIAIITEQPEDPTSA